MVGGFRPPKPKRPEHKETDAERLWALFDQLKDAGYTIGYLLVICVGAEAVHFALTITARVA